MKKGIFGVVIGIFFFIGAVNFIFFSRSGIEIAFVVGPIISMAMFFVFIVFIIKAVKKHAENPNSRINTYQKQKSTKCVKCHAIIEGDDRYCPECGASQVDTIICEYCGHENPKTNDLCEKCNGFL